MDESAVGTGRRPRVALALLACGCSIGIREPRLHEPAAPPVAAEARPELKVHLKSGELLVLTGWRVAATGDRLAGEGQAYTVAREKKGAPGRHDVPLADVALFETSSPETVTSAGLGLIVTTTVVLGGITGYCAINPKGCFGSCPTFYVEGPDGREPERPQAEGFSESIARVLEARDLDALEVARPGGTDVAVVMRNEALETHAVRRVRLLAAPRPPGGRVLAGTDDRLYSARALVPPLECRAPEGDCRATLARDRRDGPRPRRRTTRTSRRARCWSSASPAARGRRGVAIAARQTLLSTFLFYQTMAYVGRGAGEFLAALERGGPEAGRRALGMARVLGGIDVEVAEGDGPWRAIGSFDEAGPIAGDRRVLPFEASGASPLRVRLRLARGHWRLDSVALAELGEPLAPVRLEPFSVERDGHRDDRARARLRRGRAAPRDAPRRRVSADLPAAPERRPSRALPRERGLLLRVDARASGSPRRTRRWRPSPSPTRPRPCGGSPRPTRPGGAGSSEAFWASRFRK